MCRQVAPSDLIVRRRSRGWSAAQAAVGRSQRACSKKADWRQGRPSAPWANRPNWTPVKSGRRTSLGRLPACTTASDPAGRNEKAYASTRAWMNSVAATTPGARGNVVSYRGAEKGGQPSAGQGGGGAVGSRGRTVVLPSAPVARYTISLAPSPAAERRIASAPYAFLCSQATVPASSPTLAGVNSTAVDQSTSTAGCLRRRQAGDSCTSSV